MKHVFESDMVAHLWANQSQDDARNKQGNFYFQGRTIFSYGSHFPIATIVKNARGERAVLFTRSSRSTTTAKHLRIVRDAVSHLAVLEVEGIRGFYNCNNLQPADHKRNLEAFQSTVDEALLKASRASANIRWWLDIAGHQADQQNAYLKFFGLRNKPIVLPEFSAGEIAKIKEAAAEAARKQAAKAKREQTAAEKAGAKLRAEHVKNAERWLAGEQVDRYSCIFGDETKLRVNGENIETSRGAKVPVAHAKRLWPLIELRRKSATDYEYRADKPRVGHFHVDRIDANGDLVVGCHTIPYPEVARIAAQLGLTEQRAA